MRRLSARPAAGGRRRRRRRLERGEGLTPRGAAVAIGAATSAVGAVTAADRLGAFRLTAVAATPRAVAGGKVWLLATSALVADRPIAASLLGFGVVGFAALLLLGGRLAFAAGAVGHVVSGAAVYAGLAVARLVDHTAFASVLDLPDYGLSAAVSAWMGALAALVWLRRSDARSRAGVLAVLAVSVAIGWALRGSLTVLDVEHPVAFAVGAALVWRKGRRSPALPQRAGERRVSRMERQSPASAAVSTAGRARRP